MPRRALSTLPLLILLVDSSAASADASRPCRDLDVAWGYSNLDGMSRLPRFTLTKQDCDVLAQSREIFYRLTAAAGLARGEVAYELDPTDVVNGYGGDKSVSLTVGAIRSDWKDPAVLVETLAHEIGHFLQRRQNIKEGSFSRPQLEAHADLLGAQIAARAGYPSEWPIRAHERKYGCESIRSDAPLPNDTHPSNSGRWFNHLAIKSAAANLHQLEAALSADSSLEPNQQLEQLYSASNPSSGRKPFQMVSDPSVFGRDGLLRIPAPVRTSPPLIDGAGVPKPAPPRLEPGRLTPFEQALLYSWNEAFGSAERAINSSLIHSLAREACGLTEQTLHSAASGRSPALRLDPMPGTASSRWPRP